MERNVAYFEQGHLVINGRCSCGTRCYFLRRLTLGVFWGRIPEGDI